MRASRLGIRSKLAVLITLPTVALLLVGYHNTVDGLHTLRVASMFVQKLDLAVRVGTMVRELQKERGLSAGWLGAASPFFAEELGRQRQRTDEAARAYQGFAGDLLSNPALSDLHASVRTVGRLLDHLGERRQRIDSGAVVVEEAVADYTEVVSAALMAATHLSESIGDPELSKAVAAYVNLLQAKEKAGLERATLSYAFARGEFGASARARLRSIVRAEEHYVDLFTLFAAPELRQSYVEKLRGEVAAEAVRMRELAEATKDGPLRGDPVHWFQVMTGKIELMRAVEDDVAADLRKRAAERRRAALGAVLAYTGLSLSALLVAGLFAFVADSRIARPLAALERTARRIAAGERDVPIALQGSDLTAALAATMVEMQASIRRGEEALTRFVPKELLGLLRCESLLDLRLGDQVEVEGVILFADMRNFTPRSERMAPEETLAFVNSYLALLQPCIIRHGGLVIKYLGDAVIALFQGSADAAVSAALDIQHALATWNEAGRRQDRRPVHAGIGLHYGRVTLGTVGTEDRMDGTVLGDTVNVAARVEELTGRYGVSVLISEEVLLRLRGPDAVDCRFVDRVRSRGRAHSLCVYEVFGCAAPDRRAVQHATLERFHGAIVHYHFGRAQAAVELLQQVLDHDPDDRVARIYLRRCLGDRADGSTTDAAGGSGPESWYATLASRAPEIEAEHGSMFAQAERLLDAARHGGDDATLDGMLEAFRLDTERHSQREEQQMVRLRFPGFGRHKQDHQEILAAFRTLRRDATGRPAARQNFFLRVHGQLVMRMLAHTATLDREFDRFAHGDRREEERP